VSRKNQKKGGSDPEKMVGKRSGPKLLIARTKTEERCHAGGLATFARRKAEWRGNELALREGDKR